MAQNDFYQFVAMLLGIYHYGNTSCQVRHVLLLEIHHTILANRIVLQIFVKEPW